MLGIGLNDLSHPKTNRFYPERADSSPVGVGRRGASAVRLTGAEREPLARIERIINHSLSERLASPDRVQSFNPQNSAFDIEEVANNVMGLVQRRLRVAYAKGASQEQLQGLRDQAKAGIEQGLEEAMENLADMGLLSHALRDQIGQLKERLEEGLDKMTFAERNSPPADNRLIELTQGIQQLSETAFSFQLKTQEGDLVNLKFQQSTELREFLSYQQADNAQVVDYQQTLSADSRYELTVDGDLNDQELAAITEFTRALERIGEDFFAGDAQAAFEQGLQLGYDTNQIAGFALELQHSQTSIATSRYRSVSRLSTPEPARLSGLEHLGAFMGRLREQVGQAEGLFQQPRQSVSDLLGGVMSHHPEAGQFTELLRRGDEQDHTKDLVDRLVGRVAGKRHDG
jgi:hypothetical protein